MLELSQSWQLAKEYLSFGLALFAIRDKTSGKKQIKSPFELDWQHQRNDEISLYDRMSKFDTTGFGIICGKASGGLHAIDVDTKFKPGFDAILFSDIEKLYPHIWSKLRIHKTPSGGYHILYRIDSDIIPGNKKIAGRKATETELLTSATREYYFIETRGEGGFIGAAPSMGYEVVHNRPIPLLSLPDHSSLISLCKSYHEIVKIEKPLKVSKNDSDFYSTNPWEDYNMSPDAELTLEHCGWTFYSENSVYKYYTRPDRAEGGVSASFHKEWRKFYIWTSSTSLEPQKYKHPATILKELRFNGDGSACYAHLISRGFGKIRPDREKKLSLSRATFGGELPPNASDEAKKVFEEARSQLTEKYPYGIFWKEKDMGGYSISRERLYSVSESLGFRKYGNDLIYIDGHTIGRVPESVFFNVMKGYIKEEDAEIYEEIANAYESFIQHDGKFTISRLSELTTEKILNSTKNAAYKFYNNCIVKVSADGWDTFEYSALEGRLVWKNLIQKRDFVQAAEYTDSLYYQFLDKACGWSLHLLRCIGYYAHDYKSTATAYMVLLCEMNEDFRKGGRTGKNIFTNMLNFTNTVKDKMAEGLKIDDTLLRTWGDEKIFSLNDLPKGFSLLAVRELISGNWDVGKKWQQEVTVKNNRLPKLIANTNFSFDHNLPGLQGRIIPLEFTDFFKKEGGVYKYFKKMFPTDAETLGDWDNAEWAAYDTIMMLAIQEYIKADCMLEAPALTQTGWIKQFKQNFYEQSYEFINENIDTWKSLPGVKTEDFNLAYDRFCHTNKIQNRNILTGTALNRALEEYCRHYGIYFKKDGTFSHNGFSCRGRLFKEPEGGEVQMQDDLPF